jgi:hypothetical protein
MGKKKSSIFVQTDKLGNNVTLWRHTVEVHVFRRHPQNQALVETVKNALIDPNCIYLDKYDAAHIFYLELKPELKKFIETTDDFFVVCTKPEKTVPSGKVRFVASYYAVPGVKKRGTLLWQKK